MIYTESKTREETEEGIRTTLEAVRFTPTICSLYVSVVNVRVCVCVYVCLCVWHLDSLCIQSLTVMLGHSKLYKAIVTTIGFETKDQALHFEFKYS